MTIRLTGIRARLLAAYLGILILGFGALTVVAGGQISSAARQDYEQRLVNEMRLIAQGLTSYLRDATLDSDPAALTELITGYESDVGGVLTLLPFDSRDRRPMPMMLDYPEIETALRGSIAVVQRPDNAGQDSLFTAIAIGDMRGGLIAQLSVPVENLQRLVLERWTVLGLIFALVTAVTFAAALWVSRSIIQPLYALRQSALRLSKGDLSHRVARIGRDEIGDVARAFNDMAGQLQSMLEEQRAFASNTSHELRTPLTTIRLRTEALRYDTSLDADTTQTYIREIDQEVLRLAALIDDLTLLSRFDAGRAELGATEIDLARFASSLQQQVSPQAAARSITLSSSLPPDPLVVSASLTHLTVAFRNLLENAIKYTPVGGKVDLLVSAGVDGACVIVQDNGRGIAAEHLPHLFERFYRADKARSRDVPGTGLGLALVRSIIEAYGGSITIESAGLGQGTTATVFWPYRPKTPTH
ncbi:MAG: HAMP domain-containing histidine kinase [Anaerolineae bacterium]|nr:HAMP domain-containing histidine kinase [Anaerolineae bacterium]